jgi:hypothetical protein
VEVPMRSRFDQFDKQMAREGLAPGGHVETDAEVSPDARRIDIWFTPNPEVPFEVLAHLGLLGRIARTACTIEPFHDTPDGNVVMGCVCKHYLFRELLARRDPPPPPPVQWIISSGRPASALDGLCFKASSTWGAGIYEGPALTHTYLTVVSELPEARFTLLVRLMGAGRTLTKAIAEIKALPKDAPERVLALPILLRLRFEIAADPHDRTPDEQEVFMSTQDIVENLMAQYREQGIDEGRKLGLDQGLKQGLRQGLDQGLKQGLDQGLKQGLDQGLKQGLDQGLRQGLDQGLAEAVITLYETRFGEPPSDIVAIIERTHDRAVLRGWLKLVGTGSADQVAIALRNEAS